MPLTNQATMPLVGKVREMALPGVRLADLARFPDERGVFTEIYRADWSELFDDEIVQANLSVTYPGIVRAWHRHESASLHKTRQVINQA